MNGEPGGTATLTVLNEEDTRSFDIRILSGSNRMLVIACPATLPLETAVKLEWADTFVLAEVIEHSPTGELSLLVRHRFRMDDIRHIRHLWS